MSGAFLMSREIFNHELWTDVAKFRIFFYIVGNAVWSEKGVTKGGVHIGRGQYLRSYRNMREDLMYMDNNAEKYYSLNTLKKKVDELVNEGSLLAEETRLGTLYTIVNYQRYQAFSTYKGDEKDLAENGERTAKEQPENSQRTAKERPQNNKNYVNQDNQVKQDNHKTTTTERKPVVMVDEDLGRLNRFYSELTGSLSYSEGVRLQGWFDTYGADLSIHALRISIGSEPKNLLSYAEGILRNWKAMKYQTVEEVEAGEQKRAQSKVYQFRAKASGEGSLYEPSPDTLERQRKAIENFNPQQITDDSDLPF